MASRFFLQRFKNAQDFGVYEKALQEVKDGWKKTHWMWYIFPQIRGFGHSHNTLYYAIQSADEARVYLADPLLGARLREITEALLELPETNPAEIFGKDWIKLGSSMTLFDYVSPNDVFAKVLSKYFSGSRDLKSLEIIYNINYHTKKSTQANDE